MFGFFLLIFFMFLLVLIVNKIQEPEDKNPILTVLLVGYFFRIILRMFNRELAIYSDGQTVGGGDSTIYEDRASLVAQLWHYRGVHFVTSDEVPALMNVPLPPNLFGFVEYFNGGYSAIGNVSIVAFCSCLTALILYRMFIVHDSERKQSFWWMCGLFFSLSFTALTSDSFKDGLLILFVVGIISGIVHWKRTNILFLLAGMGICFWGLDGTRYYLIYALVPPVVVRIFLPIITSRFRLDALFIGLFVLLFIVFNMAMIESYFDSATDLFENSYSYGAQKANMGGGSGVDLDGGRPTLASLPLKTMYTLFAPFPWQGGSLGLHLSKIEMIFWYFLLYWFYRGTGIFLKRDPDLTMTFLVFIAGLTIVYAWSFTNIGLIYRQRLPIFFVASILAVWGRVAAKQKT